MDSRIVKLNIRMSSTDIFAFEDEIPFEIKSIFANKKDMRNCTTKSLFFASKRLP